MTYPCKDTAFKENLELERILEFYVGWAGDNTRTFI